MQQKRDHAKQKYDWVYTQDIRNAPSPRRPFYSQGANLLERDERIII